MKISISFRITDEFDIADKLLIRILGVTIIGVWYIRGELVLSLLGLHIEFD